MMCTVDNNVTIIIHIKSTFFSAFLFVFVELLLNCYARKSRTKDNLIGSIIHTDVLSIFSIKKVQFQESLITTEKPTFSQEQLRINFMYGSRSVKDVHLISYRSFKQLTLKTSPVPPEEIEGS